MKKVNGNLMGIALNLQITLGSMVILAILNLPNHEHEIFFLSCFLEQWFVVVLEEVFDVLC